MNDFGVEGRSGTPRGYPASGGPAAAGAADARRVSGAGPEGDSVAAGPDRPPLRLARLCLHGLFAALLVLALVPPAFGARSRLALVPGALLGCVYAAAAVERWARSRGVGARSWLVAVTVCWLAALVLDRGFSYLAFPIFFLYLHLLRPAWSLPAVAAATGAVIAVQLTGSEATVAKVIGPMAGAAVAVLTAYGYAALYRESGERQRLIDDLTRTRDELAASQRAAGVLAERQRLAREIHDTLAQGLSSIVLLSRAAESALPAGAASETARGRMREAGRTAADNLAEARRFVQALTPPALDSAPLPDAVRRLVGQSSAAPVVAFQLDGEPRRLPVETEVALLRLTQEALANAARHADAGRVTVSLGYLPHQVTLDVFDDGTGFTPRQATRGDTFGLRGMRERIAALGGRLTVESAPGDGTVVAAVVPAPDPVTPADRPGAETEPADGGRSADDPADAERDPADAERTRRAPRRWEAA